MKAKPLPSRAEANRLWREVQAALEPFLRVWFAPEYRDRLIRMEQEKIRRRILSIEEKLHRDRVATLRSAVGLHHLKQLPIKKAGRRMKSRAPSPKPKATEDLPPEPSA